MSPREGVPLDTNGCPSELPYYDPADAVAQMDWPSTNDSHPTPKAPKGFCVTCGCGLLDEADLRRTPMRCGNCAHASVVTYCWRCGKAYLATDCLRCDLGLDPRFVFEFAAARGISLTAAEAMLARDGVPPAPPPDPDINW